MTETGWYVYGVVDGDRVLDDPAGRVHVVSNGRIAAVAASVDLSEFDELPDRLNDEEWLEAKARDHESVLRAAAAGGPVVPLRFGAVYRRQEDVVQLLDERADELVADLDRVRGHVELGVKGFVARKRLEDSLASDRSAAGAATPGRAYLERRRAEREVEDDASAIVADAARSAHARLLERAVTGVLNRPHPRELTGRAEEMFLNAAYLVPAGDRSLHAEVDALTRAYAPLALSFEVTGPWPPYNFVGESSREEVAS